MASAAAAGGSSAAPAKAGGEELHIAAGTYTHFIQGLSVNTAAGTAKPAYSYEAHAGPVMAIAAAGSHLVSGSYDEMIKWARWEERTEDGKRRERRERRSTWVVLFPLPFAAGANVARARP